MMAVPVEKDGELWRAVEAAGNAQAGKWIFNEDGKPDGSVLLVARSASLWKAVLAKCDELVPPNVAGGRSAGMYHADGRGCSAIVRRCNNDGTATVWHVEAYDQTDTLVRGITVHVHGPWADNNDAEWEKRIASLASGRENVVIENHCWFTVGDPGMKGERGFGGYRFEFQPLDGGPLLVSTNMWFGGVIPPAFRERIPDTHTMLAGFYPGPVE